MKMKAALIVLALAAVFYTVVGALSVTAVDQIDRGDKIEQVVE